MADKKISELTAGVSINDADLGVIVQSAETKKVTLLIIANYILGKIGAYFFGLTPKTTPVDADTITINDTEAGNVLKKLTFTNLKAFLKTYFDTLYISESLGAEEVITLQNRWNLTNNDDYYRSRADFAGFNDTGAQIVSTGINSYASLTQVQRSQSSFFYGANGAKKLSKIFFDLGQGVSTNTSYTLMVVACQRVQSTNVSTSTINGINLGEYAITKTSGNLTVFSVITPDDVTIPDGYIVTCFLKRTDGGAETNCSIIFKFKNA
jgi:hypothetical protein